MNKAIISIISTVSLLSVGTSALAYEYRNYRGETMQQQHNRHDQERRLRDVELQQRQDRLQRRLNGSVY